MKKALWISPTLPHPINAGNRKHLSFLIQNLRNQFSTIDFILYGWESEAKKYESMLSKMFTTFTNIPQPKSKLKKYNDYWGIDDWISEDLLTTISRKCQIIEYDIVICEYVWMSKTLEHSTPTALKIIDTHDIFSDRDKLFTENNMEPQWFYTRANEEKIGLARADIILAITEEDRKTITNIISPEKRKVLHLPTGLAVKPTKPRPPIEKREITFGYLASSNDLNIKSINEFFQHLDKYTTKNTPIHFNVAGNICSHIKEYKNLKIYKKGYINNTDEFYENTDIIIAPMIKGTGLKIKSIEAIEHLKPLIGTKYATNDLPMGSIWQKFENNQLMARYIAKWAAATIEQKNKTIKFLSDLSLDAKNTIEHNNSKQQLELIEIINSKPSKAVAQSNTTQKYDKKYSRQVSVIIAAYNTEKYIRRCIESLLENTGISIEIIIINDGSSDKTGEIINEYALKHSSIIPIHQENKGQGAARNAGIDIANGEYLYFVDSDDYLAPESITKLYQFSKENHLDICSPDRPYLNARPLKYISALPGWCCFIKASILREKHIRQPSIRSGQDGVFANMLLTQCNKSDVCKEAKYYYEQRDESTFNQIKSNTAIIPKLVEQHLATLRHFYSTFNLFSTNAVRFALFLQDETFKWRLKPHLKTLNRYDAEKIFLCIKSELHHCLKYIKEEDLNYFTQEFLSILKTEFSEFIEATHVK